MTTNKTTAGAKSDVNPAFPMFGIMDWAKPFSALPSKAYASFYKEALGMTARQLEAYAGYVKKLADCDDLSQSLACHGEFVRRTMTSCYEDGQRAVETFQKAMSPQA
ncbi:MAG: hypothetical protein ACK4NA_10880 [Alphaproteobacteria bacterium]